METTFDLGMLVITGNAERKLERHDVITALKRHAARDWGDISNEDRRLNDAALEKGVRILSVYRDSRNVMFWIITEADRSATTVLLPEDY